MASEGAHVVVSSRKAANVENAVQKLHKSGLINVIGVKCHVAIEEDRKKLIETAIHEFGKIDILISNAAVNPVVGSVLDCPEDAWDKIFEVNVKASWLLAKEVVPHLKKQPKSSITFVSSIAGINPFPVN